MIEDDEVIAKLTEYVLAREGYEVIVAHDGPEGLAAIAEHRPAVVLLDLTLPGTSGDEVCKTIRNHPRIGDTFVVVMTARDEMEARQRARDAGADAYACKPCDPDRMLEIVARGFAASGAPAPHPNSPA